MAVQSRSSILQ